MTVEELLHSVQFMVDQNGKPTAAVLDIRVWEEFLDLLEDLEDAGLIRERLKHWRTKEGWSPWEDFEKELESDSLSAVD